MPNAVLGTGLQRLISLTAGLSWLMFNLKERRTETEEAQWSSRAAVGLVGIGDCWESFSKEGHPNSALEDAHKDGKQRKGRRVSQAVS